MKKFKEKYPYAYAGYIKSELDLLSCTSGGAATALSKYVIENGGVVAGVKYTDDFYDAEYCLIDTVDDIDLLKGSKYIYPKLNNIYHEVELYLKNGRQVLFIGLPCIVAGLLMTIKAEEDIDFNNLLTCELICHGPIDSKMQKDYVQHLEKKFKGKVTELSVRMKKEQWLPAYLNAKFDNNKIFTEEFYMTELGFAFSISGRNGCYKCKFKDSNHLADIIIGDYWGITKSNELWNDKGVSIIFAKNDDVYRMLQANDFFFCKSIDGTLAIQNNPMLMKSKTSNPKREYFNQCFEKSGIIVASKKCGFRKIWYRYKFVKTISNVTPECVKRMCKRILYKQ